jgi:hypothetical protein
MFLVLEIFLIKRALERELVRKEKGTLSTK